jgi:hypothetical protein
MSTRDKLEHQLFTWEGWDDNGPLCLQFYNVELTVQVGKFPVGTKFKLAMFDGDTSSVTFENHDVEGNTTESHTYALNVSLGEELT